MKISYRTHPVLKMLEEDQPNFNVVQNEHAYRESFDPYWPKFREKIKENIIYVSESFAKAAIKHGSKIALSNLTQGMQERGVIMLNDKTICFEMYGEENNGKIAHYFDLVVFEKDILLMSCFQIGENKEISFVSSAFNKVVSSDFLAKKHYMNLIICVMLFKKYAQVETKFLPAKKRVKDINCKYVNDTNSNITYLDSTWFTTLVKSDAFKVRGHFRLQPKKKDGKWTKELIWINEFQKNGYTAPARKLKVI